MQVHEWPLEKFENKTALAVAVNANKGLISDSAVLVVSR